MHINVSGTKWKSNHWWNNNKCWCACKKQYICERDYLWNTATCNCEYGKYLPNIVDDSAIICDEIIEPYKETNFDEKKQSVRYKISMFYLPFHLLPLHYW